MNIKHAIVCLAVTATLGGAAQQINPITRAMLNGYEEILRENPKDYQTLYERAAQLYQLSQYDRAMDDLVKALEYTPARDTDLRLRELTLMSDAAQEMKNHELALKCVDEALALDPSNYANIYRKGNICLQLKKGEEAYKAFSSMQRLKSRSQEAYFGMAQADILMGKTNDARELLEEAQAADPTNYITYCRVGDLYKEMGEPEQAASNYLIAFSMAQNPERPLQSLLELARTNYGSVLTALNYSIDRTTSKMPLLYLKGTIANATGHYSDAKDALGDLLKYPEGRESGVYMQMGTAEFGLNQLEEAIENIDKAISLNPSADLYLMKANILLGQKKPAQSIVEAGKALTAQPDNTEAMIVKARGHIAQNNSEEALALLNDAVMTTPDNVEALLTRAYVNEQMLNNGKAAVADYNRIAAEEAGTFPEAAIKGIAQAKTGKKLDADATVENALKANHTANDLYYAAVYYAQTDGLEKGIETLKKAVYEGFQNKYDLESNETPKLSILPLRRLM